MHCDPHPGNWLLTFPERAAHVPGPCAGLRAWLRRCTGAAPAVTDGAGAPPTAAHRPGDFELVPSHALAELPPRDVIA